MVLSLKAKQVTWVKTHEALCRKRLNDVSRGDTIRPDSMHPDYDLCSEGSRVGRPPPFSSASSLRSALQRIA